MPGVCELAAEVDPRNAVPGARGAARDSVEAGDLLGSDVDVRIPRRVESGDRSLAEALAAGLERDLQLGSTQAVPHRADLRLIYDERQARRLVSRGQQKLLACALFCGGK